MGILGWLPKPLEPLVHDVAVRQPGEGQVIPATASEDGMKTNRAAIAGVAIAIGAYGFAFGVLARTAGLTVIQVSAMSTLAYSGGAQAAFVGTVATGTPVSALVSALLVNLRLGVYGAMANQVLSESSTPRRLAGVHLATDETIALANTAPPTRGRPPIG